MPSPVRCYLDIGIGDRETILAAQTSYAAAETFLLKEGPKYGLPDPASLSSLDAIQLETLASIYPDTLPTSAPPPLVALRLPLTLSSDPGLSKTVENFRALCTGEKGSCKKAPNKKLHYAGVPIHRVQKGFVAQGGDVTRSDGSGGEVRAVSCAPLHRYGAHLEQFGGQSIYGGTFKDEKPGLQALPSYGSLAMANSGKNTNSSQFFVVLTRDPARLKKLQGSYVVFGKVDDEALGELEKLDAVGTEAGSPTEKIWVEGCGVL